MDHISLLCDEVWPSSPASASDDISVEMAEHVTTKHVSFESHDSVEFHHITNDDCKQALSICLKEEKSYIPKHNYLEYLESKNLIVARFRIIQWFIKVSIRLK